MSQCICHLVFPEPGDPKLSDLGCSLCQRFLFKIAVDSTLDTLVTLNQKVLNERGRNDTLQSENEALRDALAKLKGQLRTLQQGLESRQSQKREDVNNTETGSSDDEEPGSSEETNEEGVEDEAGEGKGEDGEEETDDLQPGAEPGLMKEFEGFLRDLRRLGDRAPTSKVNSLPFMRRCIEDDIRPCLRDLGWLSFRRVLAGFGSGDLAIEQAPERAEAPCGMCGRQASCQYRYRLQEGVPWRPMDKFCRERCVAVGEFCSFVRSLHCRLTKRSAESHLFQQCYNLRARMFAARAGQGFVVPALEAGDQAEN